MWDVTLDLQNASKKDKNMLVTQTFAVKFEILQLEFNEEKLF